MTAAMLATTLVGCGGGDAGSAPAADGGAATEAPAADSGDGAAAEDGAAEEAPAEDAAAAEEEIPTATFGDPNGTHMEMWATWLRNGMRRIPTEPSRLPVLHILMQICIRNF